MANIIRYTGGETITATVANMLSGNADAYWYTGSNAPSGASYIINGIYDDNDSSTSTDFAYKTDLARLTGNTLTNTFKTAPNIFDDINKRYPKYVMSFIKFKPRYASGNYGNDVKSTNYVEVRQKVNSVTITSSNNKTYGNAAFNISYTVAPSNAFFGDAVSFTRQSGTSVTLSGTASKTVTIASAGTSTIKYTSADGKCTGTFNIVVAKATPTITMSDTTFTFTGANQYMTAKASVNGTIYETWNGSEPTTTSYGRKLSVTANTTFNIDSTTNVGSWTIKALFVPTDTTNYNNASKTNKFTMNPRNLTDITATWGTTTFDYNGSAKTVTPTLKYGTITLVNNTDYTTSNNSRTSAGTQTVTVTGKGNYTGTKTTTLTVNKVNPTYTAPSNNAPTYNGSAQQIIKAGSTSHGTIYYNTTNSDTGQTTDVSAASLKATTAGSYTRYWKLVGDTNHNSIGWTAISCSIRKKTSTVTAPTGKTNTYNGSAQALASAGSCTGGKIQYCLTSTGTYSDSIPTATNYTSGTTVYWKAVLTDTTNYVLPSSGTSGSITGKINKASQTAPTAVGKTTTYPTVATATASGGGGQGSIEWSNGSSRSTAGTTSTQARWSGNTNYNASPYSSAVNLVVNKATPSVTIGNTSLTYNGSTQYFTVKANVPGKFYRTWDGTTPTTSSYNGVNNISANTVTNSGSASTPGSWPIKWLFVPTDTTNYNNVSNSFTFIMNARNLSDVTVTWGTTTFDYSGGARTVTPTLKYGSITLTSGTDYTITNNSRTAAGSQTVTVTGKGNYTGTKTTTLTVNKVAATKTNPSAKTGLVYKVYGYAQQVINPGSTSHGTFYYNTTNSDTGATTDATASSLKATNAGTVTRYWKFVADSNHTGDVSWTAISCSIGKASQTAPTAVGATAYYPNVATATASGGGGIGTLSWTNGNTLSTVGSKYTAAYWSGNTNYNKSANSNTVTLTVYSYY